MEKKIEDYLHLYLGCEISVNGTGGYKLIGLKPDIWNIAAFEVLNVIAEHDHFGEETFDIAEAEGIHSDDIKLILRPLSDMTEHEAEFQSQAAWDGKPTIIMNAEITKYLLSCSFDLFNLIENNLAIDKTQIK